MSFAKTIAFCFSCSVVFILLSCNSSNTNTDLYVEEHSPPYDEPHRPQIHFSPPANWMNDPNGMVYYEGEYHLFYQYYPDSTVWGPMHWGHTVSRDMIHWEDLPIALYPDSLGLIFSGSAVIDWNNTSGLGEGDAPPMIAIFTHHDMEGERAKTNTFQYQSIAYSNDKGRTWIKYEGNPVVENPGIKDFRDPKVIWSDKYSKWVMVFAAYDKALFYTSDNLKDWTESGSFGIEGDTRLWECPDLFPIEVEGSEETKWVLITSIQKEGPNGGTATSYFIGDFDGNTFIGDSEEQQWLDYGTDNYAFVTWADIPDSDGRRLGIGWMSNWQYAQVVPTDKWRSAMTLPRELTLHIENGKYRLRSSIVREFEVLRNEQKIIDTKVFTEPTDVVSEIDAAAFELLLNWETPKSGLIDIKLSNDIEEELHIGYNVADQTYFIDRTFAGKSDFSEVFADYHTGDAAYHKESLHMRIIVDQSSVELIADDGRLTMTDIFFSTEPYNKITFNAESNNMKLLSGSYYELNKMR